MERPETRAAVLLLVDPTGPPTSHWPWDGLLARQPPAPLSLQTDSNATFPGLPFSIQLGCASFKIISGAAPKNGSSCLVKVTAEDIGKESKLQQLSELISHRLIG